MIEMVERMHEALTGALEVVLAMLSDGRWEQRDGYRMLTAPSLPVPIANSVWVKGPDERQVVSDLKSTLEAIRVGGVSPGVLTRNERFPATEAGARRLGLTVVETMPGMVVTPDRFLPPSGPGPILVRVSEDEELLAVARDITIRGFEAPPGCSTDCSRQGCVPMASTNGSRTRKDGQSQRRWGSSRATRWAFSTLPRPSRIDAGGTGVV